VARVEEAVRGAVVSEARSLSMKWRILIALLVLAVLLVLVIKQSY
jgi:hypothetical protein